ncbi:protein kinase domain containing protein [Stylonychia lemnae]|uniref:Casein kinase I n=1 Tax=Stylonychia lemnae TaxID=5949 RepID=A0A078B0B7_STYLE|nr:protein kinase domain containing protein [Stylonychia lemnae]|eukprot:CDW88100.1 protein kinase domain containing protein [Stylonychia lemnae]
MKSQSIFQECYYPKTFRGYKYDSVLGQGTFGVVCKYMKDGMAYAVKFESQNSSQSMIQEKQMLKRIDAENQKIDNLKDQVRAPKLFLDGSIKAENVQNISYNYMVLDYFSESISEGQKSMTKSQLAIQMIEQLENLHAMNIIHRDVKLENFMIQNSKVHLIDFGSAKEYRGPNGVIPFKTQCGVIGTAYTASLNSHRCLEVMPVDDLISVIYSLIWLWDDHFPMKVELEEAIMRYAQMPEQLSICYRQKVSQKVRQIFIQHIIEQNVNNLRQQISFLYSQILLNPSARFTISRL